MDLMGNAKEHEQSYKVTVAEEDDKRFILGVKIEQQANKDYRCMVRLLQNTWKRKAWPTWGIPAEALLTAMAPWRSPRR